MWSYYGGKTTIVGAYPTPLYGTIIEPFAGAAKYSLRYWDRRIILIEKSKSICGIWDYLINRATVQMIKELPHFMEAGDKLSNYTWRCKGERDLFSFMISKGVEHSTRNTVSKWVGIDRKNFMNFCLQKIERDLPKIKHWQIINADYRIAENIQATWFIDPPYMRGGEHYPHSSKDLDYHELGIWCMQRKGQAIVCENDGGTWLPFKPLVQHKGRKGMQKEYMWSSHPFHYQLDLFKDFSD